MVKYSIGWFKKGFYSYVTSPASNGAYAMSFLTILATIPLLALVVYAAAIIEPLNSFAVSLKILVFERFTPSTEDDLMPIMNEFLSNAQKLGVIGALFGLYSAYLFFSGLDYWVQTIYEAKERSDVEMMTATLILIVTLIAIQTFFAFIKTALLDNIIIDESLDLIALWALIFSMFLILPNDNVKIKNAAIIAAFIAMSISVIKAGFVYYVYYAFSYKTIYGSFATVMFLLVWIEICWWLIFMGFNALKVHKTS